MGSVSRRAAKKKRHAWRKNPVGAWIRSRRVPDTASVRARPPRTARTPCPLERTPMTSTLSPQEQYLAARRRSVRARPPRTARTHCPLERQPNDIDFVAAGAVPGSSPTGAPRSGQDPPD